MARIDSAVVGCGIAGRTHHLPVLAVHEKANLVAVADQDQRRAKESAREYSATAYNDTDEMLTEESLESVHICTPPQTHLDVTRPFLQNGIPVVIEKPVATSTSDVDELIRLSEETGTDVTVVHNQLFDPSIQKALETVESDEIGDIVSVNVLFGEREKLHESERGDWVFDLPGGELGEGLVHPVYRGLAFVDGLGEVTCVNKQNFTGYEDPIEFDGVSVEGVDSSGDVLLNVKILTSSVNQDLIHVHGTEGELQVDKIILGTVLNQTVDLSAKTIGSQIVSYVTQYAINISRNVWEFAESKFGEQQPGGQTGHYELIDRHLDSIVRNEDPPVGLEEARDTVRVLEAIK